MRNFKSSQTSGISPFFRVASPSLAITEKWSGKEKVTIISILKSRPNRPKSAIHQLSYFRRFEGTY